MKKNLFVLVMLMVSLTSFAEEPVYRFELTASGMRSTDPEHPDYIVFNYSPLTQEYLYEKMLLVANEHNAVLSTVENKQISVKCNLAKAVSRTKFHSFDISFTLTFEFKGNKIKINAPVINSITTVTHKFQEMFIQKSYVDSLNGNEFTIFNGKGKLKNDLAKSTLEYSVNTAILSYLESILEKAVDENW